MKTLYKVNDTVWYVTSHMKAKKAKVVAIEQRIDKRGVSVRYTLSDRVQLMSPDIWPTLKAAKMHFRDHFKRLLDNMYP